MKPSQVAKLAAQTPKWPELRVTLTDPAGITVSGLTTPLTTDDPPAEAVARAAAQARVNGRPIRVTVTTTTGEVNRRVPDPDQRRGGRGCRPG